MRNNKSSELKEITLKETLILSPIEKHVLYNKFPTRFFINVILLILVTLQVTFIFDSTAQYPRETERVFRYLFLNSADDESLVLTMNSPMDIQNQLLQVQNVFMNLNDFMFQNVDPDTTQFKIHAYLKYPIERKETYDVNVKTGFTEPFNASDINSVKRFIETVIQMEITMQNLTTSHYIDATQQNLCLNWTVSILYDLHEFTQISATVSAQSLLCSASIVTGSDASVGLSVVVLILATVSLVRMISKVLRIGRVFIEIKAAYINYVNHHSLKDISRLEIQKQELIDTAGENIEEKMEDYFRYQSWEDVPLSAKMTFFSGWFMFNTVGNIFQVTASLLLVAAFFSPITAQGFYIAEVTLGLSAFFTWIQMLQYLAFWKSVTLMTSTMQKASTPLIVFFAICGPIFIGIAILGYALFWRYDKFESVGMSMRSLFALSCGDIVHESFLDTWDEGLKSILYLVLYIILYYTAFANIFVAIIMEGYIKAELRKQIDNDDPLPTQENLTLTRKMSLEIPTRPKEGRSSYGSKPEIQKRVFRELGNPNLSANAKNTINLLLFQTEEIKEELEDLLKVKNVIETRNYDKKTRDFLNNLLKTQVSKITKKINYYELLFKRSLDSRNLDEENRVNVNR